MTDSKMPDPVALLNDDDLTALSDGLIGAVYLGAKQIRMDLDHATSLIAMARESLINRRPVADAELEALAEQLIADAETLGNAPHFTGPLSALWAMRRAAEVLCARTAQPVGVTVKPLELAIMFHDTYEKLAPAFGYSTRKDTQIFDAESTNGKLMISVSERILANLTPAQSWETK